MPLYYYSGNPVVFQWNSTTNGGKQKKREKKKRKKRSGFDDLSKLNIIFGK